MNVLILNWRDPKNPKAGGAEKLNMQLLRPLIERGDLVTWYALAEKDLPAEETFEGIRIVRFGSLIPHFIAWPFFYYSGKFGQVDIIIDSVHGIGYFSNIITPLKRKYVLVCEVAKNIWDEMIPFPGNVIGKRIEPLMFWLYRNNSIWTISNSTKKDLQTMRVPKKNITVLPMGFDAPTAKPKAIKFSHPTALYVGRLAEMKGIHDAIKAIAKVNETASDPWTLHVIGRGDPGYEEELRRLIHELGVESHMKLLGYLTEKRKFEEMAKAWVLLVPSSREGWGMIVPEANYVGTAVIAYKSPGLIDSVPYYSRDNILVDTNATALASAISSMKKPGIVKQRIQPGWEMLRRFILDEFRVRDAVDNT